MPQHSLFPATAPDPSITLASTEAQLLVAGQDGLKLAEMTYRCPFTHQFDAPFPFLREADQHPSFVHCVFRLSVIDVERRINVTLIPEAHGNLRYPVARISGVVKLTS
jgi:hypothetical protein